MPNANLGGAEYTLQLHHPAADDVYPSMPGVHTHDAPYIICNLWPRIRSILSSVLVSHSIPVA